MRRQINSAIALFAWLLLASPIQAQEPVFVTEWGSLGSGDGQFDGPFDVAVDASGTVFVVDTNNNRIQKFDEHGNFITKWGTGGTLGEGRFNAPESVACDASGNVYVADTGNDRIQKFDSNGNFLLEWGSHCNTGTGLNCTGEGEGQFFQPSGITVSPAGRVSVADRQNYRVQVFDVSGNFLVKWGSLGSLPGQFSLPKAIVSSSDGTVFVLNSGGDFGIHVFDPDGALITRWGSPGTSEGRIGSAFGVTVDNNRAVYVVDEDRVQIFDSNGTFGLTWGTTGSGPGEFLNPHGIAVDTNGNIYVADSVNHRIQKFAVPPVVIEARTWGQTKSLYR